MLVSYEERIKMPQLDIPVDLEENNLEMPEDSKILMYIDVRDYEEKGRQYHIDILNNVEVFQNDFINAIQSVMSESNNLVFEKHEELEPFRIEVVAWDDDTKPVTINLWGNVSKFNFLLALHHFLDYIYFGDYGEDEDENIDD